MKKVNVFAVACALALATVFGLASCGNQSNAPAQPEGSSSAETSAAASETSSSAAVEQTSADAEAAQEQAPASNMATFDFEGKGQVFFDYPSDTFAVDDGAILPTITAKDGSVKLTFNPSYTYEVDGVKAQNEYLDGYLRDDDPDSRAEDLVIAGMNAHRVWHVDADWGDLFMRTMIDFGDAPTENYTGMNIAVTGTDWDRINADDVQAIIDSIHFAA